MDAVGDQTTRRVSSPGENDRGALQSALLALADVTADEWQRLAARRVFFGHQSVGANLIEGIEDVLRSCPDLPLRIVESNDPSAMAEPGLYHARIGENGHPGGCLSTSLGAEWPTWPS